MRILFCESSPNFGGQERQILLQIGALQRAGHSCWLACPADSAIAREASRRQIPWTAIRFRNSLHVDSILGVRRLIRRNQIDALVCHSGHDADVGAIAARLCGYHRPGVIRVRTYLTGRVRPRSVNILSDLTLVPSAFVRSALVADPKIYSDRIDVLFPIVPVDELASEAEGNLTRELAEFLETHSPVVSQAAMLRSEKGHKLAIATIGKLREKFPLIGLVIAGAGKKESALRKQVHREGLDGSVFFAGLLLPVAPLLKRSDLVIMPSRREPLGLAQVEALSLGTPVAVSDVGGLPETVIHGETGWVIPSADQAAWEAGLDEILSDLQSAKSRAEVGRIWVGKRFGAAAHVAGLIEKLEKLPAIRRRLGRSGKGAGT